MAVTSSDRIRRPRGVGLGTGSLAAGGQVSGLRISWEAFTLTAFSWWNVVPSTIGGLTGGAFAVAGMVVAGRRERDKERERRTNEAVRSAQLCLLTIEDLYSTDIDVDDPGSLTRDGYDRRDRLLTEFRTHVSSIPDERIRAALENVGRMLGHRGITMYGEDSDAYASIQICRYGKSLASRYLASGKITVVPDHIQEYLDAMERLSEDN